MTFYTAYKILILISFSLQRTVYRVYVTIDGSGNGGYTKKFPLYILTLFKQKQSIHWRNAQWIRLRSRFCLLSDRDCYLSDLEFVFDKSVLTVYHNDILLLSRLPRRKHVVYISFKEDDKEICKFVKGALQNGFKKRQMTTFIPCRETIADQNNIKTNFLRCKYCLIIQSTGIFDIDFVKRMEYKTAWEFYVHCKID